MLKKLKLELKELTYPKKKQVMKEVGISLGATIILSGLIYLINIGMQEVIKIIL